MQSYSREANNVEGIINPETDVSAVTETWTIPDFRYAFNGGLAKLDNKFFISKTFPLY